MLNKVILEANLTEGPTIRYTGDGKPICNLRIACNSHYREGETLFIGVVVFSKQAEACSNYLKKGSKIIVEGRLQEKHWEHEGRKHSKMEIAANDVRFIGGNKEEAPASAPESAPDSDDLAPF